VLHINGHESPLDTKGSAPTTQRKKGCEATIRRTVIRQKAKGLAGLVADKLRLRKGAALTRENHPGKCNVQQSEHPVRKAEQASRLAWSSSMNPAPELLSFAYWARESTKKHYSMGAMCKWSRDSAQYGGCCTHNSMNEGGNCNFDLTPGKIEELHELSRKNTIRSRVATQKAKDLANLEAVRLCLRTDATLVRQRHPGRQRAAIRASYKKGRAKVKKPTHTGAILVRKPAPVHLICRTTTPVESTSCVSGRLLEVRASPFIADLMTRHS